MGVPYYLGMTAIAHRLGYKNRKTAMKFVIREGLPIYQRYLKHRTGKVRCYCISESALTAWELAKGAQTVAKLRSKSATWKDRKRYALTG